ncbi:sensor histidine kinase [Chitinophaga ginsengisegetis]|uniref:sensor histidine kinase n=1 Tax=Chitinophaga ginsengisegetis TaxID=393003 RepID=UPI000DB9E2A7|nr:ATP-binding protein [Chitinophaga ginsengisegetis]MDR6565512.1 signal transduction histidine kinase [Chitinophaga ginsengisegetis]MDR6645241.1 signal transduction histidine kinase [Chitinophaga ginsengisegetis]MDR6652168.1 signal transduction histidine kinase [Chitinophaga ginsengisegetis]
MKLLTLVLILILSATRSYAQQPPGRYDKDSLSRVLEQATNDSVKARVSFLLADEWEDKDTLLSKKYVQLGKGFSKGHPLLQGLSLFYEARKLAPTVPDSAAKVFMQAENILKKFPGKEALLFRSMCWHDYARVFHFEKDDPETYVNLLVTQAIPLAQKSGDQRYLGKNYLDLAYGFKNLKEYAKAKIYLQLAIETLRNEKGNTRYLATAYHTLSENYSLSGDSAKAALYLDSMRVLLTPYPEADEWLDYYAGESMRLTIAEKFDQSLAVSEKGIALARKLHQPYPEQRLLLQKFYALYNKKDLPEARRVALDLYSKLPFMNTSANRLLLYYGLVATNEDMKNIPEAYQWLKRYSYLSDSVAQSNLETKINALEIKFRNAEHQRKITELNASNDKANFALKRTILLSWLLGLVSVLLFIILLLGYFFYKNKKRTALQQEQIKVSHAMLQGQEEERKRVARDLHDSLGGLLASTKINLSRIAGSGSTGNRPELEGIIGQMDTSVTELRRIAHNMMPEMLLRLGLEAALKDLCDTFESEKTTVRFLCFGIQPNIPQGEQVIIYRIAQELLTNAVKHAGAKNILLQCNQRDNRFFITVEDDGTGFNKDVLHENQGMGFINIKTRVAYLNGKIEILSRGNQPGTSINIEVYVATEI